MSGLTNPNLQASVIVAASADFAPGGAQQRENHADDEGNDSQRPEDGDLGQETYDQEDYSQDDHDLLLSRMISIARVESDRRAGRAGYA